MNSERIQLNMNANDADKLAFVLMAALHTTTMLDNERVTATRATNELFDQLGYDTRTTDKGERIDPPLTHRRRVKAGNTRYEYKSQAAKDAYGSFGKGYADYMENHALELAARFPDRKDEFMNRSLEESLEGNDGE